MKRLYYDLHIHSCLSPCAEDDMTPANICGMAFLKGLQLIAVTDHNSTRNLPAVKRAADGYGIMLLPGLEMTTREEVHVLAYYQTVEAAMKAGESLTARLPPIPNRPELFGNQLIMDGSDRIAGRETALLIGATDLSLEEAAAFIREGGGAAVPAHINRGSNGLMVNLGFMPDEPPFPTVEVSPLLAVNEAAVRGRKLLHSSDAHRLGDIAEAVHLLETENGGIQSILDSLLLGRV